MKKKSVREKIAHLQSNIISQFPLVRITFGVFAGMLMAATPVFSTCMPGGVGSAATTGRHLDQGTLLAKSLIPRFSLGGIWDALFGGGSEDDSTINTREVHPEQTVDDFIPNGERDLAQMNEASQNEQINEQDSPVITEDIIAESPVEGTDKFQNQDVCLEDAEAIVTDQLFTGLEPDFAYPTLGDSPDHPDMPLKTNIYQPATTRNQRAIAAQLDGIANPTTGQNLLLSVLVNAPLSEIAEDLDSLSGYQYTNDLFTTEFVGRQFLRRLYDPIRSKVTDYRNRNCDVCRDWTAWMEAGGTHVRLNNSKNARGFNMKGYEITAGIQKMLACDWTLGLAGSYENDNFHYKHGNGSGNNAAWLGGIYGLYRPSDCYGIVDFAYGQSTNKMQRKIAIDTLGYSAYGKPDTSQFAFYGEVGLDFLFCNCLIQPFGAIEANWHRRKRISETSHDGIALVLHKKEHSSALSRLGLHLTSYAFVDLFNISLDLAWNARLTGFNNKIRGQFAEFGNTFEIEGTRMNRNSIDYALTVSSNFGSGWEVYLEGSGESWNKAQLYNILGGIKFCW